MERPSLLQTFYLQLIRRLQELDKAFILDLHLATVDELQQRPQVTDVDAFQEEERMLVGVEEEDVLEERADGAQDHLVTLDLAAISTGQGDISEVLIGVKIPKSFGTRVLKLIPSQVHQVSFHADSSLLSSLHK